MVVSVSNSTPFGLKLGLYDVDQFLVDRIKAKLKYWSFTHMLLAHIYNAHYELSVDVIPLVFRCGLVGSKKDLRKIKAMLHNLRPVVRV